MVDNIANARYALPSARKCFNHAIATRNTAILLRYLRRLRLGSHCLRTWKGFECFPDWDGVQTMPLGDFIDSDKSPPDVACSTWPALHLACFRGFDRVVKELHTIGLPSRDARMHMPANVIVLHATALHLASRDKHWSAVRTLVRAYGLTRDDLCYDNWWAFPDALSGSDLIMLCKWFDVPLRDYATVLRSTLHETDPSRENECICAMADLIRRKRKLKKVAAVNNGDSLAPTRGRD